jgi:hypothetical protein
LTLPAGSAAAAPPQSASPRAPTGTCPKLGFVDDPTNRYSRPTQLHRCFALASPERISTQDQRDLCLSDRFPSCPRFIAAGAADAPATLAPLAAPVSPQLDRADAAATLAPSPGPAPAMETRNGRDRLPQRAHRPLVDVAPPAASALAARPGVVAEQGAGSALVAPSEEALESAAPAHPSTEAPPTSRRGRPKAHPSAAPRVKLWRAAAGASVQRVAREPVWIVLVTLVLTLGVLTLVFSRAADQSPVADTPEAPASLPATAAGTAAPSAGGPPAQTPPPAAGATAAPGTAGPLRTVLDEPFANNQRNWPHNPQSTAWLAEGGYRLLARQPGHFVAIGAPLAEAYRNVIVTATFHKVGGPPGGGYGLIVGDQGPGPRDGVNQTGRFYVLEAGDRGEVGIWRRDGDRWVDLVPWTPSEAVRPGGATNELTAQAIGQRLTFLVNGVEVASKVDAALAEGAVGVFVGGDLNDVLLDRFAVQVVQVPN